MSEKQISLKLIFKNFASQELENVKRQLGGLGGPVSALQNQFSGITTQLSRFAGPAGVGLAVGALVKLGSDAVNRAEEISDLASKLAVSTTAVQQWGHAVKMSGGDMGTLDAALSKMNANLGEGSNSTKQALTDVGLKFKDIRAMAPEQAFETIVGAIEKIEDPMMQARVAVELFGRSGQDLLPAIRNGFLDVAEAAKVMDAATVESLDRAKDALQKAKDDATTMVGGMVGAWQKLQDTQKFVLQQMVIQAATAGKGLQAGFAHQLGEVLPAAAAKSQASLKALADTGLPSAAEATAQFTEKNKAATDAMMKQIAALDQYNARVDSLVVKFSGKKVADQIRETADAVKRLKGNITGPELIELQHQLSAWVVEGRQLPPILDDIWAKNISIAEVVPQVTTDIRDLTAGFTDLWPQMKRSAEASTAFVGSLKELQKPLGPMLDNILDSMTKVKLPPPSAAQKSGLALMFQDVANDLPDVIQKAFQGGGSVGKSVGGSLMSSIIGRKEDWTTFFKASGLGTTIGGALGSVIPGLGTLLGGALGGLVGKLFGPSKTQIAGREADKEIDAIRAKLVGPNGLFGSFNELQSAALELGLTFSDAWVGRGVDGLAQLTSRLEQFEQKQQAVKALQDALGGGIDRLSSAVQVFGGVVPPALRPMVESLLTSKSLTEQMRGALRGMTEDSSWQSMQARAEALGINLRDLGEHFSQARLGEIAQGYARDIAAFSEQGANMEGVLRGMADELSTLFNDAKATGAELPETLRPWMQRLVDAGLLVDDAGRKLEDLNGVTFEEMEDRALGAVVDILEEIRDLLARGLPAAAREGAEGIAGAFRDLPPVEIDVVARRPHVYAETDDSGPPIFDTPMRRVTRSGWGWLNPGDVAGMPHLTPGATAGGGVNLSVTINANDADSVARWMRRTGGDAFIQLLRESGVHRAGMQRVLS